jgi:hypothetical protein
LLTKGEDYATVSNIWIFRSICIIVDQNGNPIGVTLTPNQKSAIDELFPQALNDFKDDPLFYRAYEEYLKGIKEGRIKEGPCK